MSENDGDVERNDENPYRTSGWGWHLRVWFWVTFVLVAWWWVCSVLVDHAHKLPPPP
jgi:hypothetical protein